MKAEVFAFLAGFISNLYPVPAVQHCIWMFKYIEIAPSNFISDHFELNETK